MREILFRGKRLDNGKWVDGGYYEGNAGGRYILQGFQSLAVNFGENDDIRNEAPALFRVDPDTVSQYTGLTDKNGQKIFEGDVVQTPKYGVDNGKGQKCCGKDKFVVGYADGTYTLTNGRRRFYLRPDDAVEAIGNRYDNPELLEEGRK